jgi:hypothetical protein
MKRFLVPPLLVSVVAVLAGVSNTAPPSPAGDRARELHRNRSLISRVVNGGLRLAETDDPLKRAEHCNQLAGRLADDLIEAADDGEGLRAGQLAVHYRLVLERGVATNLTVARRKTPMGSTNERNLQAVRDETTDQLQRLEGRLAGRDNRYVRGALQDVQQGSARVDDALKTPPDE